MNQYMVIRRMSSIHAFNTVLIHRNHINVNLYKEILKAQSEIDRDPRNEYFCTEILVNYIQFG